MEIELGHALEIINKIDGVTSMDEMDILLQKIYDNGINSISCLEKMKLNNYGTQFNSKINIIIQIKEVLYNDSVNQLVCNMFPLIISKSKYNGNDIKQLYIDNIGVDTHEGIVKVLYTDLKLSTLQSILTRIKNIDKYLVFIDGKSPDDIYAENNDIVEFEKNMSDFIESSNYFLFINELLENSFTLDKQINLYKNTVDGTTYLSDGRGTIWTETLTFSNIDEYIAFINGLNF